jgi:P-type Cu+ transporter
MIKYRRQLLVAWFIYIPMAFFIWLMPYVESLKPFMVDHVVFNGNPLYIFLNLISSSIIQFYMGRHFYVNAYKSLKHKSANMDVLVVIGTSSAWIYGVILIFLGYSEKERLSFQFHMKIHSHVHNFETSAFIICIILTGKFIETFSKMKTVDKLSELASLKVSKANLLNEKNASKINLNCRFNEIPVELLELKDFVLV